MTTEGLRIAAVVPTIDPANLRRALPWLGLLHRQGVVPVVAANSAAASAVPLPDGFVRSSDGTNPGFARSVNRGASDAGEWDWLLLLNDDLDLRPDVVDAVVDALHRTEPGLPQLLLFDPEPPRSIPGSVHALLGLSLLPDVVGALQRTAEHRESAAGPVPAGTFKSFSAVAISRGAWAAVGRMSESFLFCYEDVEYVRRLERAGGLLVAAPLPIRHNRSKSTKSRIRFVLPAIAESAVAYARTNGVPAPLARASAVASLVLRVPLVPVTSAPRIEHLRGIASAIRLTASGRRASLPPFG